MATQKELEEKVQKLTAQVDALMVALGQDAGPRVILPLEERPDYIERGSDGHASFLGLIRDEGSELGWHLADTTQFGPQVTERYLQEVLRQKVSELHSETPEFQSVSPARPFYAPPMWRPTEQ